MVTVGWIGFNGDYGCRGRNGLTSSPGTFGCGSGCEVLEGWRSESLARPSKLLPWTKATLRFPSARRHSTSTEYTAQSSEVIF